MGQITLQQWRVDWSQYTDAPDDRDRTREVTFLRDHARYGATIHQHTADVLAAALADERNDTKRHTLFLRLFAEFVNSLESLGALGWAIWRRREFRLFLDAFLSYPHSAPATFFQRAAEAGQTFVGALQLPPRERVIRAVRDLTADGSTARAAGEYLDSGIESLRLAAEQYFESNSVLLTHYNKAKHGVTMLRLDEHTADDLDFQVLAPQRDEVAIAAGVWYEVARFRASEDLVSRVHRNTHAITGSIQQLALIAWALYSAEIFYVDAEAV